MFFHLFLCFLEHDILALSKLVAQLNPVLLHLTMLPVLPLSSQTGEYVISYAKNE